MSDCIILGDYGKLSKESEHLLYTNKDGIVQKILPFKTDLIVMDGKVSITADVFQLLSANNISVYFVTRGGAQNIRFDYGQSKNVFLRQEQYRIIDKPESGKIARSIVTGKLKNQIKTLSKIRRGKEVSEKIGETISQLTEILNCASDCTEVSRLRGYEGFGAKVYFSVFDLILKPEWAYFGSRTKHPPKSNVNAVLSYIYAILICRIQRALEAYGLDTMASNLHQLCYGKDTLAYDLVEEYRAPLADTLCIKLFNQGILREDCFRTEIEGVYLTDEGRSIVVKYLEEKLESRVFYKPSNERISYTRIIFSQAELYRNVILGEVSEYIPFEA